MESVKSIDITEIWAKDPYLKEAFPETRYPSGVGSKAVWEEQMNLMGLYKDKGRLPEWQGIDLADRKTQKFIRDLIGFLEEEIIEAEDAYSSLVDAQLNPSLYPSNNTNHDFNEEVADCLHFWVELFIYSGISYDMLMEYYHDLSRASSMNTISDDVLKMALQYANSYRAQHHPNRGTMGFNIGLPDKWEPFSVNGTLVGEEMLLNYDNYTFKAIKSLKLAMNQLKNKYWKAKTDYSVDTSTYQRLIIEGWLYWTVSLTFTNYQDHMGMVYTYLLKNKVNINKSETH